MKVVCSCMGEYIKRNSGIQKFLIVLVGTHLTTFAVIQRIVGDSCETSRVQSVHSFPDANNQKELSVAYCVIAMFAMWEIHLLKKSKHLGVCLILVQQTS